MRRNYFTAAVSELSRIFGKADAVVSAVVVGFWLVTQSLGWFGAVDYSGTLERLPDWANVALALALVWALIVEIPARLVAGFTREVDERRLWHIDRLGAVLGAFRAAELFRSQYPMQLSDYANVFHLVRDSWASAYKTLGEVNKAKQARFGPTNEVAAWHPSRFDGEERPDSPVDPKRLLDLARSRIALLEECLDGLGASS